MVQLNGYSKVWAVAMLMQSPIFSIDTPQAMKEDVGQGENWICSTGGVQADTEVVHWKDGGFKILISLYKVDTYSIVNFTMHRTINSPPVCKIWDNSLAF